LDRYGVFVDAAYLYAAGGNICYGVRSRQLLHMNYRRAVEKLRKICDEHSGLPALRIYWYDAAKDAQATRTHLAIASLQGVQLRLGRLAQAGDVFRQKGVDSRIVRDLMVLSRNGAIATAYVLSGDDDLREGVSEAQERGVTVTLVGVEPLQGLRNQAPTLIRAADDTIILKKDQVKVFLSRAVAVPEADARQIGQDFYRELMKTAPSKLAGTLIDIAESAERRLPAQVNRLLSDFVNDKVKADRLEPAAWGFVCDGFWETVIQSQKGEMS
jgi:uncharacterized LabA/DUF88 family protein